MAANFAAQNLKGFAQWMRVQAREEHVHAMKIYDHVIERAGMVTLEAVAKPKTTWPTPLAAFKDAYAHEQKVTGLINALTNQAIQEKDHATQVFLQWFVTEQVEEEANPLEILMKLEAAGESKGTLLMLDHQLGKRE